MAAVKAKLVGEKNIIIILAITSLVLLMLVINANGKLQSVVDDSESISVGLAGLNNKVTEMGQKTLDAISKVSEQRSELEELRNKLTQERLKNVQLQGEIEKIKGPTDSTQSPAVSETPAM